MSKRAMRAFIVFLIFAGNTAYAGPPGPVAPGCRAPDSTRSLEAPTLRELRQWVDQVGSVEAVHFTGGALWPRKTSAVASASKESKVSVPLEKLVASSLSYSPETSPIHDFKDLETMIGMTQVPEVRGPQIRKFMDRLAEYQFDPGLAIREVLANAVDSHYYSVPTVTEKEVKIQTDPVQGIFSIQDSGVGMDLSDLVYNLLVPGRSSNTALLSPETALEGVTGRFGWGFFSLLSFLKTPSDQVEVLTRKRGQATGYRVVLTRDGSGKVWVKLEPVSQDGLEVGAGTRIEIRSQQLRSRAAVQALELESVRKYFQWNERSRITLNGAPILRSLSSGKHPVNSISGTQGSYQYTQVPQKSGSGTVWISVNGVLIQSIPVEGVNILPEVHLNLPASTRLTSDRQTLDYFEKNTQELLQSIVKQAVQDGNVALINTLYSILKEDRFNLLSDLDLSSVMGAVPALPQLEDVSEIQGQPAKLLRPELFSIFRAPPAPSEGRVKFTDSSKPKIRIIAGKSNTSQVYYDQSINKEDPIFNKIVGLMRNHRRKLQGKDPDGAVFGPGMGIGVAVKKPDAVLPSVHIPTFARTEKAMAAAKEPVKMYPYSLLRQVHVLQPNGTTQIQDHRSSDLIAATRLVKNSPLLKSAAFFDPRQPRRTDGEPSEENPVVLGLLKLKEKFPNVWECVLAQGDAVSIDAYLMALGRHFNVDIYNTLEFVEVLSRLGNEEVAKEELSFLSDSQLEFRSSLANAYSIFGLVHTETFSHANTSYMKLALLLKFHQYELRISDFLAFLVKQTRFEDIPIIIEVINPYFLSLIGKPFDPNVIHFAQGYRPELTFQENRDLRDKEERLGIVNEWKAFDSGDWSVYLRSGFLRRQLGPEERIKNHPLILKLTQFFSTVVGILHKALDPEQVQEDLQLIQQAEDHLTKLYHKYKQSPEKETFIKELDSLEQQIKRLEHDALIEINIGHADGSIVIQPAPKFANLEQLYELLNSNGIITPESLPILYPILQGSVVRPKNPGRPYIGDSPSLKPRLASVTVAPQVRAYLGVDRQYIRKTFLQAATQNLTPFVWIKELFKNSKEAGAGTVNMNASTDPDQSLVVDWEDDGSGLVEDQLSAFYIPGLSTKALATPLQTKTKPQSASKNVNFGWGFFTLFSFFDDVTVETSPDGVHLHRIYLKKVMTTEGIDYQIAQETLTPPGGIKKGTRISGRKRGKPEEGLYAELKSQLIKYTYGESKVHMKFNDQPLPEIKVNSPIGTQKPLVTQSLQIPGAAVQLYSSLNPGVYFNGVFQAAETDQFFQGMSEPLKYYYQEWPKKLVFNLTGDIPQNMARTRFLQEEVLNGEIRKSAQVALVHQILEQWREQPDVAQVPYDFWYDFSSRNLGPKGNTRSKFLSRLWRQPKDPYFEATTIHDKQEFNLALARLPLVANGMSLVQLRERIQAKLHQLGVLGQDGKYTDRKFEDEELLTSFKEFPQELVKELSPLVRHFAHEIRKYQSVIMGQRELLHEHDKDQDGSKFDFDLDRIPVDQQQHRAVLQSMQAWVQNWAKSHFKRKIRVKFYVDAGGSDAHAAQGGDTIAFNLLGPSFKSFNEANSAREKPAQQDGSDLKLSLEVQTLLLDTITHEMTHLDETPGATTHDSKFYDSQEMKLIQVLKSTHD